MDLDFDEPEDAIFVLAVLDDEDGGAGGRPAARVPTRAVVGVDGGGSRGGCAPGCGCSGCLVSTLVIAAAVAAGLGALPLASALGIVALLLVLADRERP